MRFSPASPRLLRHDQSVGDAAGDRDRAGDRQRRAVRLGAHEVPGLDRATQLQEIKAILVQPEFALGSVHAITRDGTLVIASALGSQLASYAWGAATVIFVVGAQKLVPDFAAAHERIYGHCLALEDARALEAYGKNSRVGKILEIHQEDPGRIHVVLIRRQVGF